MKKVQFKELNPIAKRANAKAVTIGGKHYLIGSGLSQAGMECDVVELVLDMPAPDSVQVHWEKRKISNLEKTLGERNSFAACAASGRIYIYGGIGVTEQGAPRTLDDLIEIDMNQLAARKIEQKGQRPPGLNSAVLVANPTDQTILLFGGANDELEPQLHFYVYDTKIETWSKKKVELPVYKLGIWQHTCHFTEQLLQPAADTAATGTHFASKAKIVGLDLGIGGPIEQAQTLSKQIKKVTIGDEPFEEVEKQVAEAPVLSSEQKTQVPPGPYLIVIGGCYNPNEPYHYVCQLSLATYQLVGQFALNPVVAHESSLYKGQLYILGGSDGNIPVDELTILGKELRREKGLAGLGSVCFQTSLGLVFYGGINPQSQSFNGFALVNE